MLTKATTASKEKLRIGLMHRLDARSVLSWSGIPFFMAKALNKHVGEVIYLGPDESFITIYAARCINRINNIYKRLTGKALVTGNIRIFSKRAARFYERRLIDERCDIIFAPAASVEVAEINTDLPIIYTSDANWADLIAYVPEVRPAYESARIEGDQIEAAAITRADAVVYPSQWPVETTLGHYGAPAAKVHTFPWGANLETVPTREFALHHPLKGRINLLLVGVDWARKGGEIAFECMTSLVDRGIDAHFTICGCVPPARFEHPNFHVIPFLNKRDPVQRDQISRLFQDAHFMVLPTRAEAFGIVISEASAHGLPALVTDTGGTHGGLRNGVNGFLMPYEARGEVYADKILSVIKDPARYARLVASSRDRFEQHLNWDSWAISMRAVMESVLQRKIHPPAVSSPAIEAPAVA